MKNKISMISSIRKGIVKLKENALKMNSKKSLEMELDEVPPKKTKQEIKLELDRVVVDIAPLSVLKAVVVALLVFSAAYILLAINGILIVFFMAFFVAAALDPVVDMLQKYRIPRALGIILVYLVVFILIAMLFANLLPLIATQLVGIATKINSFIIGISNSPLEKIPFGPELKPYVEELLKAIDFKVIAVQLQSSLQLISSQIVSLGGNLWSVILQISNGLMNFLLVLILVFFMTVDENALENFCLSIFPTRYGEYITHRMQMVKNKIGEWIRGQLIVSLVAVLITFIGLAVAGVEYSLTISVLTGICMVIPVFGRVIAAVIAVPIVLNQSPALALYLIIYYFAVSWVENNYLVPVIMNKAVGLSPIMIIFALLVGFQFLGVLGLVLAIPIATIVAIFAKDLGRRIHSS